ncbi:hypothetical protein [Saccharopolyspora sp. CA-218241]|uniref:hypothetical protein n=1 Tax=Saccharopolyspora sp. CA-218241 TaxID=3240027 RepID=UPI003D987A0C
MTNPYVVTEDTLPKDPNAAPESITGIGILESFHDVQSLNDESSWVESGLAYGGMAMEAVSMVVDPIGTLLSYGLSWLIEHVEPLKEALDWFAGDPDGVRAYGATWANVSQAVGQAAQQYSQAVEAHTAEWTGSAGDAYRRYAAEKGEALVGASELANTISTVVTVMGEVVSFVREFVRDLVADCISRLITYALEALAPPLVSLSWVVPQAVAFISKTVTKIADIVQKLTKTISNVSPKLGRMVEAFSKVMELLGKLGKKAGEAAGSAISTVGRVADKIDIPGRMADRLAESTWGKVDDAFGTNITGRNSPDAPNVDGGDGSSPSTGGDDPGTTPSTGGNGPGPTGTGGDGTSPSTGGTGPGPTGTGTSPTSPSTGGNGPGPTGTGGDGTSPSTDGPGPTGTGETPSTPSSPGTDGSTPDPNRTDGNTPSTGGNGPAPNGTSGDAPSTSSTTGDAPGTGPSPLGSSSPDGVGGTSPSTSPGTSPGVSGGTGPGGTSPSPGPTSTTDAPTGNSPTPPPASSPEPRTTSFTGDLSGGGGSTPSTPAGGATPSTPSTPDSGSTPSGHVPSPSGTSGTTPTTPSTTSSSSVDAPAGPTPQTPAPGAPRPDQPTGTTPAGGAMGGATPGGAGGPSGGSPSGPTARPGPGGGWTGTPGSPGAARPPSTPDTPAPRPRGGDTPPRATPQRPDAPTPRPAPQRPQGLGGEPPRPRPDTARPDGGRPQPPGQQPPRPNAGGPAQQPPRPSTPGPTRPDGFSPDPSKPDMVKPDAGKPDPTKPESTTPNATSNDPAKPDTTRPDTERPGDRPPNADKPRDPDGGDRPADAQPRQDPDRPADADNPRPGTPEYERKIDEGVDHLRDNRTDAGASGHTDPNMQDLARRVPDDGEHFTLDAHMGPDGRIQIGDRSYSVDEFADLMRRNPDWNGKPIRLVSCDSGDFAADLSRKLEVDVTAPRGKAWTDGQGQVFASSTDPDGGPGWPPDGGWDTHSPDGTSSPASTDGFHPTRDGEDPGTRPDDAEARGKDGQGPKPDWRDVKGPNSELSPREKVADFSENGYIRQHYYLRPKENPTELVWRDGNSNTDAYGEKRLHVTLSDGKPTLASDLPPPLPYNPKSETSGTFSSEQQPALRSEIRNNMEQYRRDSDDRTLDLNNRSEISADARTAQEKFDEAATTAKQEHGLPSDAKSSAVEKHVDPEVVAEKKYHATIRTKLGEETGEAAAREFSEDFIRQNWGDDASVEAISAEDRADKGNHHETPDDSDETSGRSGSGEFDQIREPIEGEFLITEAKASSADYEDRWDTQRNERVQQGHPEYMRTVLAEMRARGEVELADRIETAYDLDLLDGREPPRVRYIGVKATLEPDPDGGSIIGYEAIEFDLTPQNDDNSDA